MNDYYTQVVKATEQFLGPASTRFIDRQVELHLGKDPHDITLADVDQLRDTTAVAIGLLTHDKKVVSQVSEEFNKITTASQKG